MRNRLNEAIPGRPSASFLASLIPCAAFVLACGSSGDGAPTTAPTAAVSALSVTLASAAVVTGATTQATVALKDANGNSLTGRVVAWSSSDGAIATVSAAGIVQALSVGTAQIIATSEGHTGSAILTVLAPAPVGAVTVALSSTSLAVGSTAQATAALKDASGNALSGRAIAWTSANPLVATVSATGVVTALDAGTAAITATSEGKSGSAAITVTPVSLTITVGGTYSGTWGSLDPTKPAVTILTIAPVIIENCTIRGKGTLILATAGNAHVTIRNCRGYGIDPGVAGTVRGEFFFGFKVGSLTLEHNYMEAVSWGLKLYSLDEWLPDGPILVRYNQAKNLDGAPSDGKGGRQIAPLGSRQDNGNSFVSIGKLHGFSNLEIAWNEIINEPSVSATGDIIDLSDASGTADSPIQIHDNYISGGYPENIAATNYTSGGITMDGTAADVAATATAFVKIHHNQIVSQANFGIGLAAGHDVEAYANRVVSSGRLSDGTWVATSYGNGINVWDCSCYNQPTTVYFNNFAHDNIVGFVKEQADPTNSNARVGPPIRGDYFMPGCAGGPTGPSTKCVNNTSLPDPITSASEAAELTFWQQKLVANGIKPGPP